ncbi:MAG: hypothetical protein ACJA1A_000220 [Saprospiraceae bacterium]|jgi:hypothetical protein
MVSIFASITINAQVPINDSPCINTATPPFDLTGGGSHNGTTCGALGPKDPGPIGGYADFENVACSAQKHDASVWYMYNPNDEEEGFNIILEDAGASGPMSLEYYSGPIDGGCTGNLTILGSSCNSNTADIKVGNCFSDDEIIYVKITTDDAENECGAFVLSLLPSTCNSPISPSFFNSPCEADNFNYLPLYISPFQDGDFICIQGCLDFACPSLEAFGGCNEFEQAPTVWFKIVTDSLSAQLFSAVEAFGNWNPVWSVYSGESCDSITIVDFGGTPPCSSGDATPQLQQSSVFNEVSTYWVAVSYDPNSLPSSGLDDGSFELCAAVTINAIICLGEEIGDCTDPSLVMEITEREIEKEPLEGPFYQGEEVTVHIAFDYDAYESGADWLMGIVPTFGSGWDLSDFDFGINAPIGNDSTAQWYVQGSETAPTINEPNPILCTFVNTAGELTLCNKLCKPCDDCPGPTMAIGDALPSGYFWVTEGNNPGCDNDGSLGEGWGIGSSQAHVEWDFKVKVKEFENSDSCALFTDLSISFQTFSHGTAGCWDDPVGECILDRAMYGPAWEVNCDAIPAVSVDNHSTKENVRIYPVPAINRLTVVSDYNMFDISIYSVSGILLFQSKINNQDVFDINMMEFQSGLYLIKIETEGVRLIEKIIVK